MTKALLNVNTDTDDVIGTKDINKIRQERFKNFLSEGNSIKRSMLLAGYSKNYVRIHWRDFLARNVNLAELEHLIRVETSVAGLHSIKTALNWMKRGTERKAVAGLDHIAKMGRNLRDNRAGGNIIFAFQTVQQADSKGQGEIIDVEVRDDSKP